MDNNKLIEILNHRFEWSRKNTVTLFELAQKTGKLDYKPDYKKENPIENHTLLYQFQCILTTTDTQLGHLYGEKIKYAKEQIPVEKIEDLLLKQKAEAKEAFEKFTDESLIINTYITLIEHETLHQGQLITMFRLLGIDFPSTFRLAWNL